ncbi:MAG TPA: hypothetical protein VHY36_17125 [Steroidobacteraceae bacterium]|jgi:hypothetical protein|nr:hypothetical protein [Steroidobacteraceae bacterium]
MTDEDQDWLDSLAGRSATGSHRASIAEAQRLRESIRRNVRVPDVAVPAQDVQREAQLLERAGREGLIDPTRLARRTRQRLPAIGAMGALAASVAGVAIALFLHGRPQTEHLRGTRAQVTRIEAADPTALKMQILDELRAAGVRATGYDQLGIEGIDADLPQPVPPRVRDVLTRHHLGVPANGVLRIEIAAPSKP